MKFFFCSPTKPLSPSHTLSVLVHYKLHLYLYVSLEESFTEINEIYEQKILELLYTKWALELSYQPELDSLKTFNLRSFI